MGIPSYFSFIIKNYNNIIKKREELNSIQHLCMDCNSIIYDSFYDIEKKYNKKTFENGDIEELIIQSVIQNIEVLINEISPSKTVFITFDGVAPFAKMNQQRKRRYKSSFMAKIGSINKSQKNWNTTFITPGTEFMEKLSLQINYHFLYKQKKYNCSNVKVSCSDEIGEGEHKIFQWIRETNLLDDHVAIYGLDSDLIMLSIFHKQFAKNIYVFREAPDFRNVVEENIKKEEKEKLFMDIEKLSMCIFSKMVGSTSNYDSRSVYDYIFICFLLGNDFLPHIISLNIRTIGIDVILETYKQTIGKYSDRSLIHHVTKDIQWKYFGMFINELSKKEHQNIIQEHTIRDKFEKRNWPMKTTEDKEQLIENIPIIYRSEEKYICPTETGWETRYYRTLFDIEPNENEIKKICENYIEGLAWIFQYYTKGVQNHQWNYKYHYAPLLQDLKKYIGNVDIHSIYEYKHGYTKEEQLRYVIPNEILLEIFPNDDTIEKKDIDYKVKWAYCRYLWEAHPVL
uniref:Xrn1 N-terminal domain-containing protein n=1 Tax=viral metagenome TaxID=1070528 RepID=A0A6C0HZF0_9ZZZZ